MLTRETTNTNYIVYGLARSIPSPIPSKHVNNYTIVFSNAELNKNGFHKFLIISINEETNHVL